MPEEGQEAEVAQLLQLSANFGLHMPIQYVERPEFRFVCIDLAKMKFLLLKELNNQAV